MNDRTAEFLTLLARPVRFLSLPQLARHWWLASPDQLRNAKVAAHKWQAARWVETKGVFARGSSAGILLIAGSRK